MQKKATKRRDICVGLVDTYKNLDILDVACGGGHYGLAVAKQGANWTGMDLSRGMLIAARKLLAEHNQSGCVINGDVTQLPFSKESFDIIFCVGILSYFPNQEVSKIIDQFPGLLRPGGKLILQTIRLDMLNWLRSRLSSWVPRPIRLLGPLYSRKVKIIVDMLGDTSLCLSRKIEIKRLCTIPFQTIYLFRKTNS